LSSGCDKPSAKESAAGHIANVKTRATLSFLQLQLLGWSAFAAAMAASRVGRFPLAYMVATKGAMALLGALYSTALLRPVYRRLMRGDPPTFRVVAVTAVASYLAATVWTMSHGVTDAWLVRTMLRRDVALSFWYLFGGTLYNAFTMLAWSVLYVGIKHQQALYAERERALRAESLATRARLDALRWQLNPHFLFNSLNAISTLVVDNRPAEAAKMISRLADLLRSTLDVQGDGEVPLEQELELVQRYLDIEQVRLGNRLSVEIDVDAGARGARVPSLVLQPLVENAVKHAIAPREGPGRLVVRAVRNNGRLELSVEDDGATTADPSLAARDDGGGIGLANTRERLRHLYADQQSLTLDRSDLGGVRVRIELPFHE
jgi:two-component sensor histidine kinase